MTLRKRNGVYGRRGALFASTALSAVLFPALGLAQISTTATPQGGTVVGGSAAITQAPSSTTIDQSSQRAAIDWQSFDVGSAAKVQFNQPGPSAIALNRVTGGNLSQINGQINANGQIVLINQSGVVFGKGSQVNAESVVVSTSGIDPKAFMGGSMQFTGPPKPGAKIINDGNITAKDAGLVGLVAPQVLNDGVITARLGQVVIAGAAAFTLDLYGDRLISLDVTQAVRAVDVGGKPVPALVTNSGVIIADGGKITLTAADADALVTQLINAGGVIRADTAGGQTGAVSLQGIGGNIQIAGNLLLRGTAAGETGGSLQALASGTVAVAPGAIVDASGDAGGGVIAIGTDVRRAQTGAADTLAPVAAAVTIAPGASLAADATGSGNGGKITLLSTQNTDFEGGISVRGGSIAGDGGAAEISGGVIDLGGTVLATAINGRPGEILLDPNDVVIGTDLVGTADNGHGTTTFGGFDTGVLSSVASVINPASLTSLSGNVTVEANSLITVNEAVNMINAGVALSLISHGDISIQASIAVNGSLEIDASNSLVLGPSSSIGGLTAGNILLVSGAAGSAIGLPVTASGNLVLNSLGNISVASSIDTGGALAISAANGLVLSGNSLAGGGVDAGSIVLNSGTGGTVLDVPVSASGTISLLSKGSISEGSFLTNITIHGGAPPLLETLYGVLDAPVLDSAGQLVIGSAVLSNANTVAEIGSFFSNGPFIFNDTGSLNLAGLAAASTVSLSADTINLSGPIFSATLVALGSTGNISGTGGITSPSLVSNGTIGGNVSLTGVNSITALGGFTLGGTLSLNDTTLLTLTSDLEAGGFLIDGAGITESGTGSLTGGGTFGASVTGSVLLTNGANSFSGISGITAGSLIALDDNDGLTLFGGITGSSDYITLGAAQTLNINAKHVSASAAGGTIAIAVDNLSNPGTASLLVPTGTIFIAPASPSHAIDVNAFGGTNPLTLNASDFGNATTVIFGNSVNTGGITLGNTGSQYFGAETVELLSQGAGYQTGTFTANTLGIFTGSFTQPTGGELDVGVVFGTAGSGGISLAGTTNAFATIGGLSAASLISVFDNGSDDLVIAGLIAAPGVTLQTGGPGEGIDELGSGQIDTPLLSTGSVGIAGGAALGNAANTIDQVANFSAGGDILLNNSGTVNIAGLVSTPGTITLEDGTAGIFESTGSIDAAGLTSGGSLIGGNLVLGSSRNTIGTLGALSIAGAGTLNLTNTGLLDIAGPVTAPTASITSGAIDISGSLLAATLLALGSTGTITESTGSITTGALVSRGSIGGDADFTGTNHIAKLGNFTLGGNLTLANAAALDITGHVSTGSDIFLSGSGFTETGTGALFANQIGTGTRTAGDIFLGGTNAVGTLGNVSITTGGTLDLNDTQLLVAIGNVNAPNVSLTAPSIEFEDHVTAGSLALGGGTITQFFGTISTATLTSIGTLTGPVSLVDGTDSIASIGSFADAALFTLNDATPLTITGALGTPEFVITGTSLAETGAGAIDTTLLTTGTGSVAGAVSLGLGNNIGTLGLFTAGGDFSLFSPGSLNVAGPLTAQNITLHAPTLNLSGSLTVDGTNPVLALQTDNFAAGAADTLQAPGGTIAISTATANTIAIGTTSSLGTLGIPANLAASLDPSAAEILIGGTALGAIEIVNFSSFGDPKLDLSTAGTIFDTGTLDPTVLAFDAGGFIQGNSAAIVAGTIEGDGGTINGDILLTSTLNSIGVLGSLNTGSFDLTLADAAALTVDGPATAKDIALFDTNNITTGASGITLDGSLIAGSGGTISLVTDKLLERSGTITAPGGLVGIAPWSNGLAIDFGGTANGDLSLPSGVINLVSPATKILQIGTAAGHAGGAIIETNAVTISPATLQLTGTAISLTGSLDEPGVISFASAGNVVQTGSAALTAGVLTGQGATIALTGGNAVNTLSAISASSNFTFNNTIAVAINALVSAAGTISLLDANTITEIAGGVLSAPTLNSGGAAIGGDVFLTNANSIATLADFTVATGHVLDFTDGRALIIAGPVVAPDATIAATDLTFTGGVTVPGTLALQDSGTIGQTGGSIAAGTLTSVGSIGGSAYLTLGNAIATLGAFSLAAGTTLALDDTGALGVAGPLTAAVATLSAGTIGISGSIRAASLAFASTGTVSESTGIITAATLTTAGTLGGDLRLGSGNSITTLGAVAALGNILLDDSRLLTIAGSIHTPGTLTLAGTGGAGETTGTIFAGVLSSLGSIGGDVRLDNANSIAALGAFTLAPGLTLSLTDAEPLTVTGPVTASVATLSATSIDLAGALNGVLLALESTGTVMQTAGVITAGTLTTGGTTIGGGLTLADGNSIASLGSVAVLGTIDVNDVTALDVAGPVTAPSATLSAAGITFSGGIDTPNTLALASTGPVSQTGGTITAGTLISLGSITGNVTLGDANSITDLGAFTIGNGFALSLTDAGSLNVSGPVAAPSAFLTAGTIGFAGNVATPGTLGLNAPGGVTQSGGSLTAGTLISFGAATGNTRLTRGNAIGTLGGFTLAAGDTLALTDTGLLNVAGPVVAPVATLTAGTINISGSIRSTALAFASTGTVSESTGIITAATLTTAGTIGGDLRLTNGNSITTLGAVAALGNILLNDATRLAIAGQIQTPESLELESLGTVLETTGTIFAGTLATTGTGVAGDLLLLNGNTIGTLAGIDAGGHIAVKDATNLIIAGTVLTPGTITLEDAGTISEAGGILSAATLDSGGTSIGDALLRGGNSIVTLAGFTVGTAGVLALTDTRALTVAGPVSAPSATLSATGITFSGGIDTPNTLALASTGAVSQTGGTITTGTLISLGSITGNVTLGDANRIANLGGFTVGNGFELSLTDAGSLNVSGPVVSPSAFFTAGTLGFSGKVTTPGTLGLDAPGGVTQSGVTQSGGSLTAGTLISFGAPAGNVALTRNNAIGTLGGFTVAAGDTLDLTDTGLLNVAGPVAAPFATLTAGTIDISGGITGTALDLISAGTAAETTGIITETTLTGSLGGLLLGNGNSIGNLGDITAGTILIGNAIDLAIAGSVITPGTLTLADTGGVSETTGTIFAGALTSLGSIGGDVALENANSIASLGAFTLAPGFTLALANAEPLTVTGPVSADVATLSATGIDLAGDVSGIALALESPGTVSQSAGVITEATLTTGGTSIGGDLDLTDGNAIASLGGVSVLGNADITDATALTIAGPVSAPSATLSAGGLIFAGDIGTFGTLALASTDGITQTGGTITAGTLISTADILGNISLGDANSIATLGSFAVSNGFVLNLTDAGLLTIAGPVTASTASFTAGSIALTGDINAAGTLGFDSPGGITQTAGVLTAGTLVSFGAPAGNVALPDENAVATLGGFTVAAGDTLALTDAGLLTIVGPLAAPFATLTADTIDIAGGITGTALDFESSGTVAESTGVIDEATLTGLIDGDLALGNANSFTSLGNIGVLGDILLDNAGPLLIAGSVTTPATLTLEDAGSVTETTGTIFAGALASLGSIGGNVALGNANAIASLGAFTLAPGFTLALDDAAPLAIAGPVAAGFATISATGIDLAGDVAGTLLALQSTGAVLQTAGVITEATLTTGGTTLGGGLTLLDGNAINTYGSIAADGDIALNDVLDATITGALATPGTLALEDSGNVTETSGIISAATLDSTGSGIGGALLLTDANNIGAIGGLTVGNLLDVTDAAPLTLAGPVSAPNATFNAVGIFVTGAVGVPGTLAFEGGPVAEPGGIITAGTLTSGGTRIGGSVNLPDANRLAAIGNLTASGNVTVNDATPLVLAGTLATPGQAAFTGAGVSETSGVIDAAALTTGQGLITGGAVLNNANAIGTLQNFNAAGLTLNDSENLIIAGNVALTNALNLLDTGNITQTGGSITAAELTSDGGTVGGAVSLLQAGNQLPVLGSFAAAGGLSLADASALDLAGDIFTGTATLNLFSTGDITQTAGIITTGLLNADPSNITLPDANQIAALGSVTAGDLLVNGVAAITGPVTATNATITSPADMAITGAISVANSLALIADGALNFDALGNSGIAVTAATATFISAGDMLLDIAFDVTNLGITAGGDITQNEQRPDLSTTGGSIDAGVAVLNAAGNILLAGTDNITGNLAASAGTLFSQTGAISAGSADLHAGSQLDLAGVIATAGSLAASSGGSIDDTAARLTAATAAFTATGGDIALDGSNAVTGLLTAGAGGIISQDSGSLSAATATFAANAIALNGDTDVPGQLDLISANNITHTAGVLNAGTLVGSAGTLAQFAARTDFGTLGSFLMQDSLLELANDAPLTITGPVRASTVSISAIGELTLAGTPDGGLFIHSPIEPANVLTPLPVDSVLSVTSPTTENTAPEILETGTFYINAGPNEAQYLGTKDPASTLFMNTLPNGTISFAPSPPTTTGLYAPNIDLIVAAGPNGSITGNVNLYRLVILSAKNAALTGLLDNIGGQAGAGKGIVDPFPSPPIQFNSCPIGSVNCTILPTESLPPGNPLENFDISQRKRKRLNKNVQLPGVATRDF